MILGLTVALVGCASNPGRDTTAAPRYDDLYNGEMQVAHEAVQDKTTKEEAVANGDRALADGDTDRAMYEYVHALDISGGDAETLNKIGAIHVGQGNLRLAARAYALSLKLDAKNPEALEGVGLLLLRERRYEDARRHLNAALEEDPQRWQSHNGLGMLADLDGDHARAAAHYMQALDTQPVSARQLAKAKLLNNLGYSLYLSGDWEFALRHFHRALDINSDFERAWQNIGLVYIRKEQYDRALDAFQHVMEKPDAYNNVGFLCMINQQYDNAEYFLQQAIKLSPSYHVEAHENLDRLKILRGTDS
jgi:Flp pilus assembly protein TadD